MLKLLHEKVHTIQRIIHSFFACSWACSQGLSTTQLRDVHY